MHVEIQVALNFFISFLYNKLPRRRVNQFGEELERALKLKFQGHWYPEKPYKGSAFRCIKTAPPLDPVFDVAAQESGMALADIQENLPEELSIWIDPGEVSYRLGEKGVVKILYSESESSEDRADREIYRTFNPEAQCFKPIIAAAAAAHAAVAAVADGVAGPVTSQLGSMSLTNSGSTAPATAATSSSNTSQSSSGSHSSANSPGSQSSSSSPYGNSPSPTYKSSPSPINNGFLAKSTAPLTFTTATFAQTKFGSTKLKTNGKRCHRMSPTEFSSYIKQRALIQQQQQQQHHQPHQQLFASIAAQHHQQQQRPRSLSPTPANAAANACIDANSFQLLLASAASANVTPGFAAAPNQFSPRSPHGSGVGSNLFDSYLGDIFSNAAAAATANQPSGLFANNSNNNNNANKMISGQQRQPNNLSAANALSLFFDNKTILNNNTNAGGGSGTNGIAASSASLVIANTNNANFSNSTVENVTNTVTSSANKNFSAVDNTLNFNGMSYPNQHLLVAN